MQENAGLRAQISQVMVERDDLEQRLNIVSDCLVFMNYSWII